MNPSNGDYLVSSPNRSTYSRKLKKLVKSITVEPIVILYFLSSMMNNLTNQNLNLEKACRVDLNYNSSICDAMVNRDTSGYSKLEEVEVQKLVSKMGALRSIFIGSVPVILLLFVGSWSDRELRRKPLILLPICCDIFGCIGLFLCSHFFMERSVIYSTLVETIPFAIGGAYCCFFLGTFSYVSDTCRESNRTAKIGAVTILQGISMTSGTALAGVLIKPIGYRCVYALSFSMMSIAVIYGFLRLQNPKNPNNSPLEPKENCLRDFFNIQHIKNTIFVCFKSGQKNRRTKMFLTMLLTVLMFGAASGEHSLTYLYTRIKFHWDETMFSGYSTFHFTVQILGATLALTVFSKYFGMSDSLLGTIAVVCKLIASIVFATAVSGRTFWYGGFVDIFRGTASIALRSTMSKMVPSHELGKSNSIFGICEAVVPMFFVPMYSTVYNLTVKTFLGTHYLVSAAIFLLSFGLFFWLYRIDVTDRRKVGKRVAEEEENVETLIERDRAVEIRPMDQASNV